MISVNYIYTNVNEKWLLYLAKCSVLLLYGKDKLHPSSKVHFVDKFNICFCLIDDKLACVFKVGNSTLLK